MPKRMVRPDEQFGEDHGLIHEVVVTGRKVGATRAFWAELAHNATLFSRVVEFVNTLGHEPSLSEQRAQSIMGKNFLGVDEVATHFHARFTIDELATLSYVPFSEEVLRRCASTHLLVAGYPMSIMDIKAVAPEDAFYDDDRPWYRTHAFATNQKMGLRWHLIGKDINELSPHLHFDEQEKLLASDETVPRACELVYAMVLNFMVNKERLFGDVYVHCAEKGDDNARICIGNFDETGLGIVSNWDDMRPGRVGITTIKVSS